jgi:hypothetical protein
MEPMVKGPTAPKGTALPCASQDPTMIGIKILGKSATTVASNERPRMDSTAPSVTVTKEKNPLQCHVQVRTLSLKHGSFWQDPDPKKTTKIYLKKCCKYETDLVPAGAGTCDRCWSVCRELRHHWHAACSGAHMVEAEGRWHLQQALVHAV